MIGASVLKTVFLTLGSAPAAGGDSQGGQASSTPLGMTEFEQFAEYTLFVVVNFGIVAIAIAFAMCVWRVFKGPTLVDRGLAADTIAMQVIALVILLTIQMRTLVFFDAVLIISILGFVTTAAYAQFIGRRRAV